MNNNELQKFIKAFDIQEIETSKYQPALKNALLKDAVKQQSKFSKIWSNLNLIFMKNKQITGLVSFSAVMIVVLSILTYTAPYASAERLVNQSITAVRQAPAQQLAKMQQILGSDPLQSLIEAKKAKDLKEITKKEFDVMFNPKNVAGVAGTATMVSAHAIAIPIKDVKNDTITDVTSSATIIPINSAVTSDLPKMETITGSGVLNLESDLVKNLPTSMQPVDNNINKYLSYTDTNGRRVCLGIDKEGIPVFKQIVLSKDDVQDLK